MKGLNMDNLNWTYKKCKIHAKISWSAYCYGRIIEATIKGKNINKTLSNVDLNLNESAGDRIEKIIDKTLDFS